jgi:pimeloyl-ACP methyl ester carboxylesterase
MRPRTRYAKSGDLNIAYQVLGEGPRDLVFVPGWVSHLEYAWENPVYARFFERLSSFSRLILFDKRGTGLSDRDVGFPTLEERMDDLRAVMDAVGSKRATVFGSSEGGSLCILFAATHPERTAALILFGCFAKRISSPDYPWAPTKEEREKWIEMIESDWGGETDLSQISPTAQADECVREWFATYCRFGASPRAAVRLGRLNSEIDVRDVLPAIHTPTLVVHRRDDQHVNVEEGRYLSEHIPGAKFVALSGNDHSIWATGNDDIVDEVEEFLTGVRRVPATDRKLLTVLFTDIVSSTAIAAKLGDQRWGELLGRHDALLRKQLQLHRGDEVKTTGDGFLAVFDGPTRAIMCAVAIREDLRSLGLDIRVGIHTGECELRGKDISGIAVHIASRIVDHAGSGEFLVSSTVTDLVVGSGVEFENRGQKILKDVPGNWCLFAVKTSSVLD